MARPIPSWLKYSLLIGGLVLLIGSGTMLWFSGNQAWKLWHQQHAPVAKDQPAPAKPERAVVIKMSTYLAAEIIGLFIGLGMVLRSASKDSAAAPSEASADEVLMEGLPAHKPKPAAAVKRWQSCNILETGSDKRRLWNFTTAKGGKFNLLQLQERVITSGTPLPQEQVKRNWQNLLQPKLNIAWLPAEQVFLKIIQIPASDLAETMSMVELQLEKISPLPVTQIVWAIEVLPQKKGNLQTVMVVMVARDVVEKYLGVLESQGFLADRLEFPLLDQILNTPIRADGAYLYPHEDTGKFSAVIAWWNQGELRNMSLLHVPAAADSAALLNEQLKQMAWTGEVEGWIGSTTRWHLVANSAAAAVWQPLFQSGLQTPVEVITPLTDAQLATTNANRAARSPANTGIMPYEYVTRYMQEFHDRLWMRGLFVIVIAYIVAVVIYLGFVNFQSLDVERTEAQTGSLRTAYTNTMKIKAQLEILQNREALKFASLDIWKVAAQMLPEGVTIQGLDFKDGRHFAINGVAPADKSDSITEFNAALRKATKDGQLMFEKINIQKVRLNPGNVTINWDFDGDLARAEAGQ